MSDSELIHSVCRRERLTFYNLLVERAEVPAEDVKKMLNREYTIYFQREGQDEKQGRDVNIYSSELSRPFKQHFSV